MRSTSIVLTLSFALLAATACDKTEPAADAKSGDKVAQKDDATPATKKEGDDAKADAALSADDRKAKRREELKRRREEALERRKQRAAERREGMVGRPVEGDDAAAKAKARRDKVKRIREQRSKFRNLRREQGAPKIPGITKPNGLLKKGGLR